MSFGQKTKLSSGYEIPTLGYGTWQSAPGEVSTGVYEALKAGYRHLDLAKIYENQPEVAIGLKKALAEIPGLKREDIFITSKLWNNNHKPEHIEAALDQTLKELDLEYLDLYLIHWPVAFKKDGEKLFPRVAGNEKEVELDFSGSVAETWKAVNKLPKSKVRTFGVSNITAEGLQALIDATGITPAVNQVERHPYLSQSKDLVPFAKKHNIHLTAYSAFGNNNLDKPLIIHDETIKKIAERVKGTPAQVILAWSQVGGHSVIPKSVTPTRIRENFQEVKLSEKDVEEIDALDKGLRYNIPFRYDPRWNVDTFGDEAEKGAAKKAKIV